MTSPRVVLASGHVIDAPGRTPPRFPPEQEPRVRDQVRRAFDEWGVGLETTVITGGARGADLIVAEEGLRRGAKVMLCLALPQEEFERRSVELPGSNWVDRFRQVLKAADVRYLSERTGTVQGDDVFTQANLWMVEEATRLDSRPHAVIVWNGKQGDGPGGTKDLVHHLGVDRPDQRVCVIDPTPRAYEERQAFERPKRLLAIDGGGLRGALSLEILAAIEKGLRDRYDKPDLVLADYFDYIAGTSTGAVIAVALALGRPVDEVRKRYESLGHKIFARRLPLIRLWSSRYKDKPLRKELDDFFGAHRKLGDPELRTLLLVVMHNTVTDSPWPLSNCTMAKYNRADRNLLEIPDRNLDIPLAPLVRASTAAPIYFKPQELKVGRNKFVFQDGGVTPFNNPGLLLFLMATLPEYGLRWPVGEKSLLLVSVGTGSSAAVHPKLRPGKVTLPFNARNLPSVFMNGASVSQDLLCRSLGRCLAGPPIDREFGARLGTSGVSGQSLFTYVRYNADLSDEALKDFGVDDPKRRKQVRKLDAVKEIPLLQQLGRHAAAEVALDRQFDGFL
jgi:hypothetical protein